MTGDRVVEDACMSIDATNVDLREPGWLTSKINVLRFKARVARYRFSYARRPGGFETAGLVLAIVGCWTVISYLGSLAGRDPWLYGVLTGVSLLLVFTYLVRRHLRDFSSIFDRASVHVDLAKRLFEDCAAGMRNQRAWDLLWRLYVPLITQANEVIRPNSAGLTWLSDASGRPFLCVVLPAPPNSELSSLLQPGIVPGQVDPKAASFAEARQAYIYRLRGMDAFSNPWGDEDGDNLILSDLSFDTDGLRIACSVATYGEIVRTSDALHTEFATFAFLAMNRPRRRGTLRKRLFGNRHPLGDPDSDSLVFTARDGLPLLPWRRQVHQWSGSAQKLFFAPGGRAAGLGVSVAMVSAEPAGESAFVARRAPNVGIYPGALHVVPSGMCNSKDDLRSGGAELPSEYIKWIMLVELLEECFDLADMADSRTFDWIASAREALKARGLEGVEPELTGLTFDLLNLRWDVCARVDVRGGNSRQDYKLCWEYDPLQQVRRQRLERVGAELDRREVVQAGAGSLALAHSNQPLLQCVDDWSGRRRDRRDLRRAQRGQEGERRVRLFPQQSRRDRSDSTDARQAGQQASPPQG